MGMTIDEAKNKMDFLKKAYQKLIDEKVDSGKLVGDGVSGERKAETPLDEVYKDIIEALDLAIKALEQQPCEDCISRDGLLARIDEERKHLLDLKMDGAEHIVVHHARRIIEDIPSVTPTRPKGKWIEKAEDYYKAINEYGGGVNEDTPYFVDDIACPKCLKLFSVIDNETERFDFCPNCGAEKKETKKSSGAEELDEYYNMVSDWVNKE